MDRDHLLDRLDQQLTAAGGRYTSSLEDSDDSDDSSEDETQEADANPVGGV